MKYSLKKKYNYLFENFDSQQHSSNVEPSPLNVNYNPDFDPSDVEDLTFVVGKKNNIVITKPTADRLLNVLNAFLSQNNKISLIVSESESVEVDLYNKNIFDIFFVLCKENVIKQPNFIFESSSGTVEATLQDFNIRLFNTSNQSGGGNNLLINIVEAKSVKEFILNIFVLLYRKLVEKKTLTLKKDVEIDDADIEREIKLYLSKIVEYFKKNIINNQSGLSTTFGTTFEVIALNRIKEFIRKKPDDEMRQLGINEELLQSKDIDIMSKKASVLLLLVMQGKFNKENEFYRLLTNQTDFLSNNFWVNCFFEVFKDMKVSNLEKLDVLITEYATFLGKNAVSEIECNEYEYDKLLLKGSEKVNIKLPTANAYFDFIIRTKNVDDESISFGLFDLKCTNANVDQNKRPVYKGKTGNNKNNRAIKNIYDTVKSLQSLQSNDAQAQLCFIGLVEFQYKLSFANDETKICIEIEDLEHIYNSPIDIVQQNKINSPFLDIRNKTNKVHINPDLQQSDYINIDRIDTSIKFSPHVAELESIFNFLDVLIKERYSGNFNEDINASNWLKIFTVTFKDAKTFFKIKNFSKYYRDKITLDYSDDVETPEDYLTMIDKVSKDMSYNLSKIIEDSVNFLISRKNNKLKTIHDGLSEGSRQAFRRRLTNKILEIIQDENGNVKSFISQFNISYLGKDNDFSLKRDMKGYIDNIKEFFKSKLKTIEDEANRETSPKVEFYNQKIDQANRDSYLDSFTDSYFRRGKVLKEVYSNLFKKKIISEGGLAGHMMHPYEALDMTPRQIIDRIKEYSTSQKIIEKVDGQNLFFTVEEDGTLMFARNKADMTHDDLVAKFTGHGAEKPFVEGGNAIKSGVEQWLSSAGDAGEMEIREIFHPDGETKSFINFEIMHPDKENQIVYDKKYIVFHSIVDYVDGRKTVFSTNKGQRLEKIIRLMTSGVSSAGFTLASNRTVDLNKLTNVQILSYIKRVKEIADQLEITDSEFLGDGVEKQIKKQLDAEGINISNKAIKILYDFALYGEDRSGNKIKSKDFTSLMQPEDVKKLRAIDLTNANKAAAKVRRILAPFKEVFVDLGIDLLDGVPSAYMDRETDLANIDRLRDKLETAMEDLSLYMRSTPESNWDAEVNRLKAHYDKVEEVGIYNAVSTSVEGGVYDFEGDLLKVTGGFAPLNQILGAAYRDKKGIFPSFKEKFMQQESNRRSLKGVFNLIF